MVPVSAEWAERPTRVVPRTEVRPFFGGRAFLTGKDVFGLYRKPQARVDFAKQEKQILELWAKEGVFQRSLEMRNTAPNFVFYEGPPTANGLPHIGHVLPRAIKDLIPRYKTMDGYKVLRKAGWDTHGLPVELEVERELGISGKPDIEAYGVAEFIERCRTSVFRYQKEWETVTERIGFWLDLEDAYITYTPAYVESVWWAIKKIWDRGLLYKGHKVVPYCPRCGTSLSSHEVAQGYQDAEDPSVFVRFPVVDEEHTSLLVWTTTPWTLPSNTACAVAEDEEYATAELDGERFIMAAELVTKVLGEDARVVERYKGSRLVGMSYYPPFAFFDTEENRQAGAFKVYAADFVSLSDGTGIVHMAPAFGEDDMKMGVEKKLPLFQPVDSEGNFVDPVENWKGRFVKEADPDITDDMKQRGLLFRGGTMSHTYPFCWRCDTPLLYYARSSWFIRMTEIKQQVIENNKSINWYPAHLRDGRFGDFLDNLVDWCLSRERFWGTPLPIWECECGHQHCIGGYDELRKMALESLPEQVDPHKPFIDEVHLECPKCGGQMNRVHEVIDCWFDSGSMPFAQHHYPFENRELFESQFPADYICEAIDQTRGWFYSLLAISTLVFDQSAYKNCLVTGHGLDADGQKMSKHKGNVVDPWNVLERYGADVLRWFLYASSPPWYPKRFAMSAFDDIQSQVLDTLWNTYVFFTTYAEIDGYEHKSLPDRLDLMDRWILSRLNSLIAAVRSGLDSYDITNPARKIHAFIDDLSNWYVRRNRKRFWKSQLDYDKEAAYATLYTCLSELAKLMAPFTPFISEALYQGLDRQTHSDVASSVHLVDYPVSDASRIDTELEHKMDSVREYVGLARACRNATAIRTRQPLPALYVWGADAQNITGLESIIADEINVKQVVENELGSSRFVQHKLVPRFEVLGPKHGRNVGRVAEAVRADQPEEVVSALLQGKSVEMRHQDLVFSLSPDEVEIRTEPKEQFAISEDEVRGVALDLAISAELRREGLAREVVNRVQKMRKDAGFLVEDTIIARYEGSDEMVEAISEHEEYIKRETLALELVFGRGPNEFEQDYKVDGYDLHLEVKREQK